MQPRVTSMTEENRDQASCAVSRCCEGKVLPGETSAQEPLARERSALGIQPLM